MNFVYDVKKLDNESTKTFKKTTDKIAMSTAKKGQYARKVEITEIINPFKHLSIDENYKLIAYSYHEIPCGIICNVGAIRKDSTLPEIYFESPIKFSKDFMNLNLYPPNEVIFCDGTPEGYFESILFKETIFRISTCDTPTYLSNYIFSPTKIRDNPNEFIIMPQDWTPKFYTDYYGSKTLLIYEQNYVNGISLCEYSFYEGNSIQFLKPDTHYLSHINLFNTRSFKERFSNGKYCCLFSRKEINIRNGNHRLNIII